MYTEQTVMVEKTKHLVFIQLTKILCCPNQTFVDLTVTKRFVVLTKQFSQC